MANTLDHRLKGNWPSAWLTVSIFLPLFAAFLVWNHFICIAYSQLTRREGLRDLVACLNSQRAKLYHIGIRGKVSRSTLADANERRDWRLFEALGHRLIAIAVELHHGEDIGLGLKEPLYALDSTTIDLCLTLFP